MKKAILLSICMGTMCCSFAQEISSDTAKPVLTKEAYLKKSKVQKTGAIVLVSAGGAMVITGLYLAIVELGGDAYNVAFPYTKVDKNNNKVLSAALIVGGLGTVYGSIRLFVSARKNKRMAYSVYFKNEYAPQLQQSFVINKPVPSLNLKIRL